jgi:hypothetical protein
MSDFGVNFRVESKTLSVAEISEYLGVDADARFSCDNGAIYAKGKPPASFTTWMISTDLPAGATLTQHLEEVFKLIPLEKLGAGAKLGNSRVFLDIGYFVDLGKYPFPAVYVPPIWVDRLGGHAVGIRVVIYPGPDDRAPARTAEPSQETGQ